MSKRGKLRNLLVGALFCFVSVFGWGADHCIRFENTYNGDGTTWAAATGAGLTGAYNDIPAALTRGDTYYFGDGTRNTASHYYFDDAESGSLWVYIKKATIASHGTNTGWDNTYGDGQTLFTGGQNFLIRRDYIEIDGQVGGGPGSWFSGHGFKWENSGANCTGIYLIGSGGDWGVDLPQHVILAHIECEMDTANGGEVCIRVYGASGAEPGVVDLTIQYCWVHVFERGIETNVGSDHLIEYCAFSESKDHAQVDALHILGEISNLTARYNVFRDCTGTGAVVVKISSGQEQTGIYIYGNIFYQTSGYSGLGFGDGPVCSDNDGGSGGKIDNFLVYNNTFSNISTGLQSAVRTYDSVGTPHTAYNNMWLDCSVDIYFNNFTHDYNYFHNTGFDVGETPGAHSQTGAVDPCTDVSTYDFTLSQATNDGYTLGSPYNQDLTGATRGDDGVWDRGAYEYPAAGGVPIPVITENERRGFFGALFVCLRIIMAMITAYAVTKIARRM